MYLNNNSMTRKLFLGFSLMACLILLPQCGKVTQEIDRKAEKKREDFGLEVQLSVLLSEDEALPTASRMISEDKRLYASVFSVAEGAGLSSLSWGQIQLRNEDETDASGNVSQITVGTAMNRSDIVLKKADYQESYIKHSMPTGNVHDFEIQSRKLRLGFPMYILAVYS